jgi:uncharacterized protein with HEPN domain
MKKEKPNLLARLLHIQEATEKIARYIQGLDYEGFSNDEKTVDAVVRQIMIIGKATYHLPKDFKEIYPHIVWSQIEGMRHKIVHDYYETRLDIVWAVAYNFAPQLLIEIASIIPTIQEENDKNQNEK